MKRRGRRRRNPRTQRPARVINSRTGVGRTTLLETSEWARPPTSWDVTALAMRVQVRKAEGIRKRAAKKRYIARAEARKESRAEAWRVKYRKPGSSPFSALPGMGGRVETSRAAQPTITETERRRAGMASRGSPTTLTPETASAVLELRAEGMSYREIGQRTGHPESTVRHWIGTNRAAAVSRGRGQTN